MKVYTEKALVKVSSEMVLLFGLLEEYQKEDEFSYNLKGEGRYHGLIEWCKEHISYVDTPEDADVLALPYKFKGVEDDVYIKLAGFAKDLDKKLLCFYIDDSDKQFDITPETVLYRTSFYKTTKKENELAMMSLSPDFFEEKLLNEAKLRIGYCGQALKQRLCYLNAMNNNEEIHCDYIFRPKTYFSLNVDKMEMRKEFFDNLKENLFIFCYRGHGNYSYRLYEVLMMGRIPVLVDTDCVLPNEEVLTEDVGVFIDEKSMNSYNEINEHLVKYYTSNKDKLLEIQKNNRKLWEKYYSPIGFVQNLIYKYA